MVQEEIIESKQAWFRFTQNSTFHGVNRVFNQESTLSRRLLWMTMVTCMFVAMVYFLANGVHKLLYPQYMTQIMVTRQPFLKFPAVTICSVNMFKQANVNRNPEILKFIMNRVKNPRKRLLISDNENLTATAQNISLEEISSDNLTQTLINGMPTLGDIIYNFGPPDGQKYNAEEVFSPVLTSMGMCYTFNLSADIEYVGQEYALNLQAVILPSQYFFNGVKRSAMGLKILVHHPDELPEVSSRGIAAAAAAETLISMKKSVTRYHLDTGCVQESMNTLSLYDTYSKAACFQECRILRQVDRCGCKHLFDPGNFTVCLRFEQIQCTKLLKQATADPCMCPPKCVEEQYQVMISSMPSPSPYYEQYQYRVNPNRYSKEIWKNIAWISIYFESLSVTEIVETKMYSISDFFSDVGGLMGLWLGASVITWAELLEVIWDGCIRRLLWNSQQSISRTRSPSDKSTPEEVKNSKQAWVTTVNTGLM